MSTPLSVESLYYLDEAPVKIATIMEFSLQVKNSPSVHQVFFSTTPSPSLPSPDPDWINSIACSMVCSSISRSSLYGFSGCVDQAKADSYWQLGFNSQKAVDVGRALFDGLFAANCRFGDHTFNDYLNNNPTTWAAQLAKFVTTDQFVNIVIAKLIADQPNWLAYLNSILYKLHRLDESTVKSVLDCWTRAYPDKGLVLNWQTYNFIPTVFFRADQFIVEVNTAISVCRTQPGPRVYHTQGGSGGSGGFSTDSDTYYYGEAVQTFVAGNGASFASGQGPSSNVKKSGGASCFVSGTTILLAERSIAIEALRSDDVVVAKDGGMSLHSNEKVVVTFPHDITIYGINDDAPFFTAGHPFSTSEGWKAIDPEIAREENPSLKVSKLGIGDTVYRVISRDPFTYETVVIKKMGMGRLAAGEKVYGLHLIDGHHSYHANGYLVRMNYPILTEQRLLDGFSTLSPAENRLLSTQLQPVMPLLKKAVGGFIEAPFSRALSGASLVAAKKKPSHQHIGFHRVNRDYQIRIFNEETALYHVRPEIAELHLEHGNLSVDGVVIEKPTFNYDTITWIQHVRGKFSSGVLHFTKDRLACVGHIYKGDSPREATRYEVSAVTPPSIYTSQVAKQSTNTQPSVPLDKSVKTGDLQQGPDIQIGYQYQPNVTGSNLPTLVVNVRTKQNQEWADISNCISLAIDPVNQNLMMTIDFTDANIALLSAGIESYGILFPASGKFEFAWDANSYSGYMQEYDQANEKIPSVYYYLLGTMVPPKPSPTSRRVLSERAHPAVPFAAASDRVVYFDEKESAAPASSLSVAELYTFMPDKDQLQKLSQDMLIENMKWAIGAIPGNTWLNDFFGELQPTLSEDRITMINKNLDFYQKFAYAYLGWGIGNLSGAGAPSIALTPDEKTRLQTFLKTGLASDAGYNLQSNDINIRAFKGLFPRINDYLADSRDWGQLFFDAITTQQQINLMMGRLIAGDNTLCNHHVTLLTILSPNSQLVPKYLSNFPMLSLLTIMNQPEFKDSADNLKKWLPDFINTFIQQYITLPSNPTAAQIAKHALAEQLKEISEQVGSITELVDALTDVIINSHGASLNDRAASAMSRFSSKYPKLAKLVGFLQVTMWGFALFQAIAAFKNWQNLSDADRAKLVISLVALTGKLIEAIPEIVGTVKLGFNQLVKLKNFCAGNAAAVCEELSEVDKKFIADGGDFLGNIFNVERKIIQVEGTLYEKFFQGASRFLRWMGPVVAAALAGLNTYTFVEDIIHGAPTEQEAFDGIIAVSATLETVCLVLEIADVSAAFFGPAAAVLAVVGAIFAIVEAFLPQPKPESPTDKFMDALRANFLPGLPLPPQASAAIARMLPHLERRLDEVKSERSPTRLSSNLAFFSRPTNIRGIYRALPSRRSVEGSPAAAVAGDSREEGALVIELRGENRFLREQFITLLNLLAQSRRGGQPDLSLQLLMAEFERINRNITQLSGARQDLLVPLRTERIVREFPVTVDKRLEPEIKEDITQPDRREDDTHAKGAPTMGKSCCIVS